jgi:hypothetical protein
MGDDDLVAGTGAVGVSLPFVGRMYEKRPIVASVLASLSEWRLLKMKREKME